MGSALPKVSAGQTYPVMLPSARRCEPWPAGVGRDAWVLGWPLYLAWGQLARVNQRLNPILKTGLLEAM